MFTHSEGSGELTSSTVAIRGLVFITAVHAIADGTNKATINVYNSNEVTTDVSRKVGEYVVDAGYSYNGRLWTYPRKCDLGIYVSISGVGASAIVEYIKKINERSS